MIICKKPEMHVMKITGLSLVWILIFGALVTQSGILSASAIETVPLSPTNLIASAISNSQISLAWNPPINATGITGYQVEYKTSSTSYSILSTTGNLTTYLHTGLTMNTTYTYRVSAINSAGMSNPSNESVATTFSVPSAPRNLSPIVISSSQINLSWTAPSNNGGTSITGYLIQRNGTTIVSNTSSNQTIFTDTNLLPLHQQTYQVAAWNSIGLGTFSNSVSGITISNIIQPFGNGTNQTSTNLRQLISDLEHQRDQLLKQQRQETLAIIHDCRTQIKNASVENKTQIIQDCKTTIKNSQQKYKNLTSQLKTQLAQLNAGLKSQISINKKEKHSGKELSNLVNMTRNFESTSENKNNHLGNMTKYSENRLPNFQNIINHFEKKSGKQNKP